MHAFLRPMPKAVTHFCMRVPKPCSAALVKVQLLVQGHCGNTPRARNTPYRLPVGEIPPIYCWGEIPHINSPWAKYAIYTPRGRNNAIYRHIRARLPTLIVLVFDDSLSWRIFRSTRPSKSSKHLRDHRNRFRRDMISILETVDCSYE